MLDLKEINEKDPLKRLVERENESNELSPMDPPEAYSPPTVDPVDYEALHPYLKKMVDEHTEINEKLTELEKILAEVVENGPGREQSKGLSDFFAFLDSAVLSHNLREEKILFPELKERMIAGGDHSNGPDQKTAIDLLEDDHIKVMQLAAVTFNFIGMSSRLPDANSRMIILDAGLEQAKSLIEIMRLHTFREDHIIIPLAEKYFSKEEFDVMDEKYKQYPNNPI